MKTERLSLLFEKIVINGADHSEQSELKALYKEFINDDNPKSTSQQSSNRQMMKCFL
jgi:hypothetical protein